jgi:uncharacterized protein (TIGR02996 family)
LSADHRSSEKVLRMSRDALFRAILDDPEDDALRLVFADWLEDHGEADRAEFIRVQIERERLGTPAEHCHFGDARNPARLTPEQAGRREGLLAREAALWEKNKGAWRAELPVVGGIDWSRPRRGFVEEVTAESFRAFRTHAGRLFGLTPLRGLRFGPSSRFQDPHSVKAESGIRLAGFPALARLRHLEFHGSNLGDRGAAALANSPHAANLVSLELSMSTVDDAGASALAESPYLANLRGLLLYMNRIGDVGAVALARSRTLRRLAVINLELNHVGDRGGLAFARTDQLPELLHLNLSDQFSGPLSAGVVQELRARWGDRLEVD